MTRLLFLAATTMWMSACQAVVPALPEASVPVERPIEPADPIVSSTYLLAPGDQLEIIVHTAPELSRTVTIAPDGEIRIPYSGPIAASGKSLETVQQRLREALASELRNPDIDVLLVATAATECGTCNAQNGSFNPRP
nr:polysaccharide biosynthesis/export family protein [Hyphomonas sp. Mor2]